jgi:hypothetical protein
MENGVPKPQTPKGSNVNSPGSQPGGMENGKWRMWNHVPITEVVKCEQPWMAIGELNRSGFKQKNRNCFTFKWLFQFPTSTNSYE